MSNMFLVGVVGAVIGVVASFLLLAVVVLWTTRMDEKKAVSKGDALITKVFTEMAHATDWKLLAKQKYIILEKLAVLDGVAAASRRASMDVPKDDLELAEALNGVLNLIDAYQDRVVEAGIYTERAVFVDIEDEDDDPSGEFDDVNEDSDTPPCRPVTPGGS